MHCKLFDRILVFVLVKSVSMGASTIARRRLVLQVANFAKTVEFLGKKWQIAMNRLLVVSCQGWRLLAVGVVHSVSSLPWGEPITYGSKSARDSLPKSSNSPAPTTI
ncbi:hypothetical protein TcasGA2_TC012716 [Tribolium castaneum]|uniref:Uncharacterized protein n=1 Tax=Tribolium castaneum TaxID=7070 RepID=D6WZS8_TRICA|nr:hypothetical protein TcasGA2_TC012716 [Tribolium castaneum]